MRDLVLENQLIYGTVNAGPRAFDEADPRSDAIRRALAGAGAGSSSPGTFRPSHHGRLSGRRDQERDHRLRQRQNVHAERRSKEGGRRLRPQPDHHRQRGGQRHARARAGADRKNILLLERGGWLPREKQNWSSSTSSSKPLRLEGDLVDKDGKPFQPGMHCFVGGATKMYGAALYRLRERDFGELRHQDGLSPAWPMSYADIGAVLHAGREPLSGPRRARRGPDRIRPPARPIRTRPSSHEPRIQQLHDDLGARRLQAVSLAVRHPARRAHSRPSPPAFAAWTATGSPAWCTPSPMPRQSRSEPR